MSTQSPNSSSQSPTLDIRHIAHLARLELTEAEMEKFSKQLGNILAHVEQLKKLDVEGVEPTAFAVPLSNVLRADEVKPSLPQSEAVKNAPKQRGNLFIVPKVVE